MKLQIEISKNGNVVKTFENQPSDFKAFKYLLDHQPQSIDYAIKYGGWKVKLTDSETGEVSFYEPYDKQ